MSSVKLELEGFAGTEVDAVLTDAVQVAQRVGCWVGINVNGVRVLIGPTDLPKQIIENYAMARARKAEFVSANIIPSPPPRQTTHQFKPDRKYPWFCGVCGYGPDELLQHTQEPRS